MPIGRRNRLRRTARCLLVALAGFAVGPREARSATGPAVPAFEVYDREIVNLLEKWQVPGAAIAIAVDGRIVFARGYGYADRETERLVQPDTRFRICSIGKPVTAAMVLKLVEDGRLSLDDHPFALLNYPTPDYPGARRDPRLERVTIWQLLNHTGGWRMKSATNPFENLDSFDPQLHQREIAQVMGVPMPASSETVIRYMVGQPLQAEPGTVFEYSPFGYSVLGRIIELKTGMSYEQAVQNFLARAGISHVAIGGSRRSELAADEAVYYDKPGAPLADSNLDPGLVAAPYQWSMRSWDAQGGWIMSPIECVRFLMALDGVGGGAPLLKPETVAAMRTMRYPGNQGRYGYGWYPNDSGTTLYEFGGHAGGMPGSATWALRGPGGRMHIAIFLNNGETSFGNEAYLILHRLAAATLAPATDLTAVTLGWDAWQTKHFGGAVSAPIDDPDHDGLSNLLEYAAGLDPTGIDARPPATLSVGEDGVPMFTYRRLILEHPLTWTVETSSDGQTWSARDVSSRQTVLNADGTESSSMPVPGAARARLRVRQQSNGAEALFEPALSARQLVLGVGESATFSVPAPAGASLQWRKNGVVIPGATGPAMALSNVQSNDAGIYTVDSGGAIPSTRVAAVVAIRSNQKVTGTAEVVGNDIRHPNGTIYDQVLLTGRAATITADPGQVTRISYVDLNDDIVQVEFSGPGSLTLALANASERATPRHYNQDVRYVKGHATILVADADADTHVSVFSVGRANAVNQALFKEGVAYDGIADLAAVAIQSTSGKAGGLYLGNAHLFAATGVTGIYAAGVEFGGPVRLGDVSAFDGALPSLIFGSVNELAVTGGALHQENGSALPTLGLRRITLVAGGKSDGTAMPAQANQGRFTLHGSDITPLLVGP